MYENGNACLWKSVGEIGERKVIVIFTTPPTSIENMLSDDVYSNDV